ncbi:MAG: oligosaccharide flippase family protein [Chloracidobacterium sp.]|nr:oligosaccharide flippase family protein [Chloracidobacterium sp.]
MTPDNSERRSSDWDIRNAPRNYVSLIAFQAFSALFSFVAVWLITRYFGSSGYGSLVAIIAASQIAQIFVNWTCVAVVRYGVEEFVDAGAIAATFWTRLVMLAVNLFVVGLLGQYWFGPVGDWLKLTWAAFPLVLSHFAFTAVWVHMQMSLQAAKMLRAQGFLQMLERLLIVLGIVGLIATGGLEFSSVVACYIAAPALMAVVGLVMLRNLVFRRFRLGIGIAKKIVLFSLPLLPFTLVGYLSGSYVDAAFVSKFLSTSDLGVYSVATQINGIAMQLPTLANTVLLPLFITLQTEDQDTRTQNYFRNVLPVLTLGWGVACAVIGLAGNYAIPLIFGPEYSAAGVPLWILLAASAVALPATIGYAVRANALSMTYVPMTAAIAAALVNVIGNMLLIPGYGTVGCAIATLLAFAASVIVFAIMMRGKAQTAVSWIFLAIAPAAVGSIVLITLNSAATAFVTCVAAASMVALLKRDSLGNMTTLIANLRRPA